MRLETFLEMRPNTISVKKNALAATNPEDNPNEKASGTSALNTGSGQGSAMLTFSLN